MNILISIYIIFFLAIATYVGINIFHLVKFRIGFRGDKTNVAIGLYIAIVIGVITISWIGGILAYNQLLSTT